MRARPSTCSLALFFACALHASARRAPAQTIQRLSPPGSSWSLDVSLPGFEITDEKIVEEGRSYALDAVLRTKGENPFTSFILLEVRMEPAQSQGGAAAARDFFVNYLVKTNGAKKGSITTAEFSGAPAIRYERQYEFAYNMTYGFGVSARQQSLEAYLVKDGTWITIRLSAPALKDAEINLFRSILDSVRFPDTATPATSFDYYQRGRALSAQKKYEAAAEALTAALRLEQQRRRLEPAHWRKLVMMLTDLHGMGGDIAAAKGMLDYGVANDPTYPVFHLGLARYHALRGDLDNTIASLQKAFAHRDTLGQSAPLPDPMSDPAFERFYKDEKFRKAVKAMKKQIGEQR